jgi:hypothetical protein
MKFPPNFSLELWCSTEQNKKLVQKEVTNLNIYSFIQELIILDNSSSISGVASPISSSSSSFPLSVKRNEVL